MAVLGAGAPQVQVDLTAGVGGIARALAGRFLVQAITSRGIPNVPVEITNETAFYREFGTPIHNSGLEIIKGLRGGAIFIVSPVHDFTTPSDESTIVGTRATVTLATTFVFNAKTVGNGYNGITVEIAVPLSGQAGVFDIVETVSGQSPNRVTNVTAVLTPTIVAELNQKTKWVNLATTTGTISVASGALAGGARDISLISNADIIGVLANKSGVYSFGKADTTIMRVINLIKQDPAVDAVYSSWAESNNKSCHIFTKIGDDVTAALAYRNGTTPYSHTKLNTHHTRLITGAINLNNPINADQRIQLVGAGDLAIAIAKKDSDGFWLSAAQLKYGQFTSVNSVVMPFDSGELDTLYDKEVNVIKSERGIVRYFGYNTTVIDKTSLLRQENIADLHIFMKNVFEALAIKYQFVPNTQSTLWSPMYKEARVILEDLVDKKAIQPNEGEGWEWIGDQNARGTNQLQYNNPVDITQGIYKAKLRFQPVGAAGFIGITLERTSQAVNVQ
jgi:hypothetical protein